MPVETFLRLDLPQLMAALFATLACALLGNFLVLRRQSLMGDAISHAVLPGIVVAFLFSASRETWPMFAGAAMAAFLAVVLIDLVVRYGRMDPGTAMAVVFSTMFAAGIVLIEQAAARNADLDADCVLYGQLEDIIWLAPTSMASLLEPAVWADLPREVVTLGGVLLLSALVVGVFWKELKLASFDPALATALGYPAHIVNMGLMALVGLVAVAAFEAVGSILVIAMLICPAAAARMLTDRLATQVAVSLVVAVISAIAGYVIAGFGPLWVGHDSSVSASGMIAVVSGICLGLAILFAPRYGTIARWRRSYAKEPEMTGRQPV
ncbi:MAG: metal ABC transporter permease [Hyphomicrobium sp.]|nr:metal ABC transporter permease [Hyphomicrobium sp.]